MAELGASQDAVRQLALVVGGAIGSYERVVRLPPVAVRSLQISGQREVGGAEEDGDRLLCQGTETVFPFVSADRKRPRSPSPGLGLHL